MKARKPSPGIAAVLDDGNHDDPLPPRTPCGRCGQRMRFFGDRRLGQHWECWAADERERPPEPSDPFADIPEPREATQ